MCSQPSGKPNRDPEKPTDDKVHINSSVNVERAEGGSIEGVHIDRVEGGVDIGYSASEVERLLDRMQKSRPRLWIVFGVAAALVLAIAVGSWAYLNRIPPMGKGFNVAVAPFTQVDENGRERVTAESRDISSWLYEAVERETEDLPSSLQIETRGPDKLKPVLGEDRQKSAEEIAKRHNARLLIYGRISQGEDGYRVQPEFYVDDDTFAYGSEIAGPERLGKAVYIGQKVDTTSAAQINAELAARARVLQYLVSGMAQLFFGNYREAELKFEVAATEPEWDAAEGKEVSYLLLGAARLLSYDALTNPDVLNNAYQALETAVDINPEYARPYLGLADIALLSATRDNPDQGTKLSEAADLYRQAAAKADQDSVIALKAEYGLGKVNLLGFEAGLPGWTTAEAQRSFEAVIDRYDDGQEPLLAWPAAHAHAYLGRLAGWQEDWPEMSSECRRAVDILRRLKGEAVQVWVARYWACSGFALRKSGDLPAAISAYHQAVEIGSKVDVSPQELESWRDVLAELEKGTPTNEQG